MESSSTEATPTLEHVPADVSSANPAREGEGTAGQPPPLSSTAGEPEESSVYGSTLRDRVLSWFRRPSMVVWGIAIAAIVESVILTWVQGQNYLGFHATQGDLGDYNQAFFTTVHGQGFLYYTTNIPGGSSGSLWATHFSPTLLLLLPLYAIAPSPVTLLFLKQAALALSAIPLYGIAKVYFRKGPLPVLFASLYLISPLTLAVDWNSFDPEAFLPLAVLAALYFFAKGRFWPFMFCWVLALGTIEAAPALLMLFAVGGLFATFIAPSSIPYLTALQQRRPLLIAILVAGAWFAVAYVALLLAGPRGGGFGDAYAVRYSILGASSFPDVLPQALTHPGAAAAALQFGGLAKILFLELVILATGAVSLLGGLRYVLPLAGYMVLAFLSNNAGLYIFGTQYVALILGFMFVAAIEGTVLVVDFLGGLESGHRRRDLALRLTADARDLAERLPVFLKEDPTRSQARRQLERAVVLLGRGELGPAERELERVRRALGADSHGQVPVSAGAVDAVGGPNATNQAGHISTKRRNRFSLKRGVSVEAVPFAFLTVLVLTATALANPLISEPLGRGSAIAYGLAGPDAHDQILHSVLQLIPPQASVLTTSHLFPELSSRPNAYVVVDGAYLRGNENISGDLNAWVNRSNFVAIDYRVDPTAATFYRYYSNLSAFGLYAAEDGAYLYERGWQGAPSFWMPWTAALAGGQLTINHTIGSISPSYASPLGPSLYHKADPKAPAKAEIWTGPRLLYLPPGNYSVTFDLELNEQNKGPQLLLRALAAPAIVEDNVTFTTGQERFHTVKIVPGSGNPPPLGSYTVNATKINRWIQQNVTISFEWNSTGYVSFPGTYLSNMMSLYLVSIQVFQRPFLA